MSNPNQSLEIVYNCVKNQIIDSINKIANENNLPTFLISLILNDIAQETTTLSFEKIISQNKVISKEEYAEFLKFKQNQNDKDDE